MLYIIIMCVDVISVIVDLFVNFFCNEDYPS